MEVQKVEKRQPVKKMVGRKDHKVKGDLNFQLVRNKNPVAVQKVEDR